MADQVKLAVSAADDTEELIQDILAGLTPEQVDQLDIDRSLETSEGMAGEPVTIGAVLTGSALVITAVLRVVEKYMEMKRQERALRMVAEGFAEHPELGRQLSELSMKHAQVAIQHGVAKGSWER